MPPKGDLGNMHIAIQLVTTVVGLVWRTRCECEEIECLIIILLIDISLA